MTEIDSLVKRAKRYMGRELNRAFEKRQIGDYGYTFVVSDEEAVQLLQYGKEFVNKITSWLNINF